MPDHITLMCWHVAAKEGSVVRTLPGKYAAHILGDMFQVMSLVTSPIDTLKVVLLHAGSWDTDGKPGFGVRLWCIQPADAN